MFHEALFFSEMTAVLCHNRLVFKSSPRPSRLESMNVWEGQMDKSASVCRDVMKEERDNGEATGGQQCQNFV